MIDAVTGFIVRSFKVGNYCHVLLQLRSLSLYNNKQISLSWTMVDQNRNVSLC